MIDRLRGRQEWQFFSALRRAAPAYAIPPLDISMDFIAGGLVDLVVGVSAAILLVGFRWWAALLLALAWLSTHWLLRESGVWKDRNTDRMTLCLAHLVDAGSGRGLPGVQLCPHLTDAIGRTGQPRKAT